MFRKVVAKYRDVPDTGYISGIWHYAGLFEMSGRMVLRYRAGYWIFSKFRKIAQSRVGKNKMYIPFRSMRKNLVQV